MFNIKNKLIKGEVVKELEYNYCYLKECVRYKEICEDNLRVEIRTCEDDEDNETIQDLKRDILRVENTIDDLKLNIKACLEVLTNL